MKKLSTKMNQNRNQGNESKQIVWLLPLFFLDIQVWLALVNRTMTCELDNVMVGENKTLFIFISVWRPSPNIFVLKPWGEIRKGKPKEDNIC